MLQRGRFYVDDDGVISLLVCLRQIKSVVIAGAESRVALRTLSLPRLVSGRVIVLHVQCTVHVSPQSEQCELNYVMYSLSQT